MASYRIYLYLPTLLTYTTSGKNPGFLNIKSVCISYCGNSVRCVLDPKPRLRPTILPVSEAAGFQPT